MHGVNRSITCSDFKPSAWRILPLPGANHILAQPLERCSASRIKPDEAFELAKKRQTHSVLGGGEGEEKFLQVVAKLRAKSQKPWKISLSYSASRIKPDEAFELAKKRQTHSVLGGGEGEEKFLQVVAKLRAKSQKPWKISLSYSFAVEMGHFDMVRWKYDSVCIFSMLRDTLGLILWKKADKNCKDEKRGIFFAKGALIGKSVCHTQRINAVHGRCSSSDVLRDIPSNFTLSLRRQLVL